MSETARADGSADGAATAELPFQAEVKQVLDIVIHSLYSHREIFLRELVSNASDALDKLRFRAVTDQEVLGDDKELEIRLRTDSEQKTLTISDNGIGMTRAELIENLGTIAHSGSKRFLEALKEQGKGGEGVDLIGQFGVGFYSSYLVADRVVVRSRSIDSDEAFRWSSDAGGTFRIEPDPEWTSRGTEITLHLKDDHEEFLDEWRIRNLVERYSDYVGHPIKLAVTRQEGEGDDEKDVEKLEVVNKASAIWRRSPKDVTDEQYEDFYKHLTHDFEAPLARTHFTIEGTRTFTGLLFVPGHPPFDLFERERRRGVRLYVKRVFIMDECEDLLPSWLRFMRGVIDSDDLPLNVSRELLQEDRTVKAIRKNVIKKTLDLLESIEKDEEKKSDYETFWEHYGTVLKEGLYYDPDYKVRLAILLRFDSSAAEGTSLAQYVARMPEGQKAIYYAIGPNRNAVDGSPHTEVLKKRGYEVIFMTDAIDEWAVQGLQEFEGKKLVSAMRADLDLEDQGTDEEKEERKEQREAKRKEFSHLVAKMKATLGELVGEVRVSSRLDDSPCCLVVPEGGVHAHIERMLRGQNKDMPATKRIFEINPDHPIVRSLSERADDADFGEWTYLLYDQALIAEGSPIADPPSFARRMARLMTEALPARGAAKGDRAEKAAESEE